MANEETKDFNAMLRDSKDMPKFQIITDEKSIEKYGGNRMYLAPPIDYDRIMRLVPFGKLLTVGAIREYFAKQNGADYGRHICLDCCLGQFSANGRQDALLENIESERGTEPKVSRRYQSPERNAGKRRAYHYPKGQNKSPILCQGL